MLQCENRIYISKGQSDPKQTVAPDAKQSWSLALQTSTFSTQIPKEPRNPGPQFPPYMQRFSRISEIILEYQPSPVSLESAESYFFNVSKRPTLKIFQIIQGSYIMFRIVSLLLLVLLSLLYSEGTEQVGARNMTEPECPSRKKNLVASTGQICQRSCERRACSKSRVCVCDGDCGMSCVLTGLSCPWPAVIGNAETNLMQESSMFGDFMEVKCKLDFRMANGEEIALSRCQGDGKWSFTAPCDDALNSSAVCNPPPEIENGYHEGGPYKTGKEVRYWCDYGYRLEGPETLLCQENQEWSHTAPTCHLVTCSRPDTIPEATLVAVHQSEYPVGTVIYYLCNRDFFLDGSNRVVCQVNGTWSQLPYCRARCPILAQRSRVIYQEQKLWVYEIPNGLVHHGEPVTFFCRSANKTCSYKAESRCFDGVLRLPDCYDEPTYLQYHLFPKRLVSEISAC